jgi:hypothetical protein
MNNGHQRECAEAQPKQSCPVCGHDRAERVEQISLAAQYRLYAPNEPEIQGKLLEVDGLPFEDYTVLRCVRCRLEYADPLRAPTAEWYEYAYNRLDFHASDRWEFNFVANTLQPRDRVGEVGCGTGVFLQKCKDRNVEAHGLDFAAASVERCHLKGLSASLLRITDGPGALSAFRGGKRTVMASFHVLEHLDNPNRLFELASEWGTEDAVLWVAVPSDTRLDRLLHRKDFLDDPPHHLTRWTPEALAQIGARNHWHLKSITKEPLGLRLKLWLLCTEDTGYWRRVERLQLRGRASQRALRYLYYPYVAIRRHEALGSLSGFSVLAQFTRRADNSGSRPTGRR